jgi:hypothetical protein
MNETPFSPSQLINANYFTSPSAATATAGPSRSPASLLQQQHGGMVNASPESGTGADIFEFDQLFAEETMERAGLGHGDQLPL